MLSCYVYILRCKDGTLYTGWTTDLTRRVARHNTGSASKFTAARRPVTLIYSEPMPDKSAALKREYAIKAMSRTDKLKLIEAQIEQRGAEHL